MAAEGLGRMAMAMRSVLGWDGMGLIGIFCAWPRKDGVEFGLKVFSDGWDGADVMRYDALSWDWVG